MNILYFPRDVVVACARRGIMNKKSDFHFDVCKALSEGKTLKQVADQFDVSDETIKQIKSKKCKEC